MDQIKRFRTAYNQALEGKWKGGTASISMHLRKRKRRGHLPSKATEADLTQRGLAVLQSSTSKVYEYVASGSSYFVVFQEWAVFFDEKGLWDTVFPPDVPERYFTLTKGYQFLGELGELTND